jgi:hypothetical protein
VTSRVEVEIAQPRRGGGRWESMEQEGRKGGRDDDGTGNVIGALIEVHRALGPGLLEFAYEAPRTLRAKALPRYFPRQSLAAVLSVTASTAESVL